MTWTDEDAQQVVGLLTTFNGAEEVCAVMGCDEDDLDALCRDAFGRDFEHARAAFAAQGRAMVRKALFEQALEGSAKALDMLARDQLGMGAVEIRKRAEAEGDEGGEHDEGAAILALIQGRRKDRRTATTA